MRVLITARAIQRGWGVMLLNLLIMAGLSASQGAPSGTPDTPPTKETVKAETLSEGLRELGKKLKLKVEMEVELEDETTPFSVEFDPNKRGLLWQTLESKYGVKMSRKLDPETGNLEYFFTKARQTPLPTFRGILKKEAENYAEWSGGQKWERGLRPIVMTEEELRDEPTWRDWNRLHYGALVVSGVGIKQMVGLTGMTGGLKADVIALQEDGESQKIRRTLTIEQKRRHWGAASKNFWDDDGRGHFTLGFISGSLGGSSGVGSDVKEGLYLGFSYDVNPYLSLILGGLFKSKESSGVTSRLAYGITADLGLIGQIFE